MPRNQGLRPGVLLQANLLRGALRRETLALNPKPSLRRVQDAKLLASTAHGKPSVMLWSTEAGHAFGV